jgi:pimeloyl-ACP methyl ester carboxylesterase
MAYWRWGDPTARHVVLCVHGLSRQGRDFDVLAQALLTQATVPLQVVCPDVVGRGFSPWLSDPLMYQVPTYAADMLELLRVLKPQSVDWIGTSMGGLIGMTVAGALGSMAQQLAMAQVQGHANDMDFKLAHLVLNDVGPVLQWQALQRIGSYLGKPVRFASIAQGAEALGAISKGFGPHTPEEWAALSRPMLRPDGQGGFKMHYDPQIAVPFAAMTPESTAQGEAVLWHLFDAIQAPTLIIRGGDSDLLLRDTALEMTRRGPGAQLVQFEGVGHAPTLIAAAQVQAVTRFLGLHC